AICAPAAGGTTNVCQLATCTTNADCPAGTGCLADYCCDGRNVCVAFCPPPATTRPVTSTPRRPLPPRPRR
ncbi:MAG: hypothetical protein JOZ41_04545, partial [Chloroflexi bacterium]|nr:hypothetical protein [Chloroflexota bacterium]